MATWMAVALVLMTLATPSTYGLVLEGSHTSYAQFRQWHGGHNDSLTFEFSTNQSDALLLYSDNNQEKDVDSNDSSSSDDEIIDGYVVKKKKPKKVESFRKFEKLLKVSKLTV